MLIVHRVNNENEKKIFYGWIVLAALFTVGATGPMGRYSLTAFFPAMSSEMGWSRSEIGLAQSVNFWVYSLASIGVGWMVDRVGSRKTIFMGGLLCLAGWLLLSRVRSFWQLYLYFGLLMGLATASTHMVPIHATSRKWFIRRAGLAGGIIGSAFAVGNAIFIPVVTSTASLFGWRAISTASAFVFGIPILLLAWFVLRDTPESIGEHPDGTSEPCHPRMEGTDPQGWCVRAAIKTPQLWLLFLTYGFSGVVVNALQAHLVIWGTDLGSSAAAAGLLVTLFNTPSIAARVGGGWLADRHGKRRVMIAGAVLSLIVTVMAWLGVHDYVQLLIFIPILGLGTSLSTSLFAPYLGDLYGRRIVGSLFAVLTLSWGLVGGFGPMIWGYIFDATGDYSQALLVSALFYALALAALLLIRETGSSPAPRERLTPNPPATPGGRERVELVQDRLEKGEDEIR